MSIDNIILIGMPGSGKSTVGVILAKTLGYSFIDTDLLVCNKEKDTLQNIIDKNGYDKFLKIEGNIVKEIDCIRTVVATGGSVVLQEDTMFYLKNLGKLVFLDVPIDEIERRITNITTRGIAFDKNKTLKDIYKARLPLYRKYADLTIPVSERIGSTEAVVAKIIEHLKEIDD